jgi:hypothetical protein
MLVALLGTVPEFLGIYTEERNLRSGGLSVMPRVVRIPVRLLNSTPLKIHSDFQQHMLKVLIQKSIRGT